jgi:hypothetical protein
MPDTRRKEFVETLLHPNLRRNHIEHFRYP